MSTRMQRATKYAEDRLIEQAPQWADPEFRKAWWAQASPLYQVVFIRDMCAVADEQLETPEIIEAKDI